MYTWKQIDPEHTRELGLDLLAETRVDKPYIVLVISSCVIATLGLLSNSAAVIIGAMIIAPLMFPIRSLAFGALVGDTFLFKKSIIALLWGTFLALFVSCLIGWLTGLTILGSEIMARTQPNLLDLGIAISAGAIGGYAKIQPKVSGSIAGTAIAVALMPPICVIGLGVSQGNWFISRGATILYLTNLLGIALACMLVFLLAGYAPLHQARKPLLAAFFLTSLLLIPLGISFSQIVEKDNLERNLKQALLNRTVTFQRLELVEFNVRWRENPPEIYLTVRANEPVTPKQVQLLESFLHREIGHPFKLIFIVSYVEEVTRDGVREIE
ncbi:MAG: DUF389 domain-containing protein [Gloeocapsa sp. DLM2.Bin57]|nr:MAG: DUF389 domain-containing protein [Gloeocapsa sp. DLM2.Bin57]